MARRSTSVLGLLLVAFLTAFAAASVSADELPSSPPELYRVSSGSAALAKSGFTGKGVTVAIIDTGIADVAPLKGKVIHQENISAAPKRGDQFGHGTFVAGIIHAAAPDARFVSIKLSGENGAVDVTQVLAALQWVVQNRERFGIDVVNLSFGNDSKQSAFTSPLNYAVQRVWDAGIVVVASAGNLGDASGTVTKPADDPLIISVGSTDEGGTPHIGDDVVSAFSSRGPTQDQLTKPDLVAPGARLVSLRAPGSTIDRENPHARVGTDYFRGSGTSFSAPLVSGVVAQMLSAKPDLSPDQVKFGLLRSGQGINGDQSAQGNGAVQALEALKWASVDPITVKQRVNRSNGRGSIHAARGSALVDVKQRVKEGNVTREVSVPVRGERTVLVRHAKLGHFDRESFRNKETWNSKKKVRANASQWGASQWGASQWGASQWGASQWGASQWGASQWGASQWGASQWGASEWWASQWG